MTTAILSLWQVADTLSPQYARGQAELLVNDMTQDDLKTALDVMGFTPNGNSVKMKRRIIEAIVELSFTGERTRQIDAMFAGRKS